jgi:hypothetical protein
LAIVKRFHTGIAAVGALRQRGGCPDLQHCEGPLFGVACDFQALPGHRVVFGDVLEKSHARDIPLK